MPHPQGDGEGAAQPRLGHARGDPDRLRAVELEHLVAVMPVVRGQTYRPVGRTAGGWQQLHSAPAGTWRRHTHHINKLFSEETENTLQTPKCLIIRQSLIFYYFLLLSIVLIQFLNKTKTPNEVRQFDSLIVPVTD